MNWLEQTSGDKGKTDSRRNMSATGGKEKKTEKTPECVEPKVKKSLEENDDIKLDVSCDDDVCGVSMFTHYTNIMKYNRCKQNRLSYILFIYY